MLVVETNVCCAAAKCSEDTFGDWSSLGDGCKMTSLTKELADIFLDDSENDVTFYGFSDSEVGDEVRVFWFQTF